MSYPAIRWPNHPSGDITVVYATQGRCLRDLHMLISTGPRFAWVRGRKDKGKWWHRFHSLAGNRYDSDLLEFEASNQEGEPK